MQTRMDDYAATQRLPDRSPAAESVHRASEHEKCAHLCGCAVLVCCACVFVCLCLCAVLLCFAYVFVIMCFACVFVCLCFCAVLLCLCLGVGGYVCSFTICEILAESKSEVIQSMGKVQHSLSIAD